MQAAFILIAALTAAAPAEADPAADTTLIRRILYGPDAATADQFQSMIAVGAPAVPVLNEALADRRLDFRKRWLAARALGRIGGEGAVPHLIRHARDPISLVRTGAALALGDTRNREAIPVLSELLLHDRALIVQAAAADALGMMGDGAAVDPLVQALFDPRNFRRGKSLWVRQHIILALGQIRDRRSLPSLIKSLDEDDPVIQGHTLAVLESVAGVRPKRRDGKPLNREHAITWWKRWWRDSGREPAR